MSINIEDIFKRLESNSYPGRGIMIGKSEDGREIYVAYFIMGRSENSRNRVFVTSGQGIKTQAHDPAKLTDPSLIIYSPVRVLNDMTIVTNGDQTDTIYDHIATGGSFETALRSRVYEPDRPNYTPRISGIVYLDGSYKLSILKRGAGSEGLGDDENCMRSFYEYKQRPGIGHFISTYNGNGDPLPSFAGEPAAISIRLSFEEFADKLWCSLNAENKVSLFVRSISADGQTKTKIYNKLQPSEETN